MNQSFVLITPAELQALIETAIKNALDASISVKKVQEVEFLTVAQSAKMLRVSTETIYNMVDSGQVEFKKVGTAGRNIRIKKHSLIK